MLMKNIFPVASGGSNKVAMRYAVKFLVKKPYFASAILLIDTPKSFLQYS